MATMTMNHLTECQHCKKSILVPMDGWGKVVGGKFQLEEDGYYHKECIDQLVSAFLKPTEKETKNDTEN